MRHGSRPCGMPRRAGRAALLAVAIASLELAGACSPGYETAAAARSDPTGPGRARRILLVGLDGADWSIIDPLVAAGRLPILARLRARGRTATLIAAPPLLSPIIWTTIATGRHPDDHGVLDFMVDLPAGGQAPVGSIHRKTPALWNLFSSVNRSVAVVGWWATWPAEDVHGTIVSDQLAPQLMRPDAAMGAGLISPAASVAALMPLLVRPEQVDLEELRRFIPLSAAERAAALREAGRAPSRFYANRVVHLAAVVAGTRTHVAMAERLLREQKPDFAAVYLEAIDTVSHLFVKDAAHGRQAIEQA